METRTNKILEVEYEGAAPSRIIVELDNQRLLSVQEDELIGQVSRDAGRTWGPSLRLMQNGNPMAGNPSGGCSLLRLSDGRLGMAYFVREDPGTADYETRTWYFATSDDDGRNWGTGHRIDIPGADDQDMGFFQQFIWGQTIQLSTGRIIAPGYWEVGGRHPGMPPTDPIRNQGTVDGKVLKPAADPHLFEASMCGSFAYYSDDLGATWHRSIGSIMVWPLPSEEVGGFGATNEPTAIELRDGRVMMLLRTNVGCIFKSFSEDGGRMWSAAEPTSLASGDVHCWVGRLKSTGDLLVIWNQASPDEIRRGYSRARLSIAISSDEGNTWGRHKNVSVGPGVDPVEAIEAPPIRHVRPSMDVGELASGFAKIDYPRLAFVQDRVVFIYNHTTYPDFWQPLQQRLKIAREQALYE